MSLVHVAVQSRALLALVLAPGAVIACSDSSAAAPGPVDGGLGGSLLDGSTTASPPNSDGGLGEFDYGYRPQTAQVYLEYLIGRTESTFGVRFVKSRTEDVFVRSPPQSHCYTFTSAAEGGKIMDSTVYALPGTVTVSGGDPHYEQSFTPSQNTFVQRGPDPNHYFLGGEDVHFSSTGAEVAAFDLHQQFPLVLRLKESPPADGTLKISRDQDLNLSWTRGAPNVDLSFDAFDGSKGVVCRFDSAVGHATIPRELLALVPTKTAARILTLAYSRATVGPFDTEFQIFTDVFFALPDQHSVYAELE